MIVVLNNVIEMSGVNMVDAVKRLPDLFSVNQESWRWKLHSLHGTVDCLQVTALEIVQKQHSIIVSFYQYNPLRKSLFSRRIKKINK